MSAPAELWQWVQEHPDMAADELYEHRLKALADEDELTPEQEALIKDRTAQVRAALEQIRDEMGIPWNMITGKQLSELAPRVAAIFADWRAIDTFLVGTWLAASARHQIMAERADD